MCSRQLVQRVFPPSVLEFMKRTSIVRCTPEALARVGPAAMKLANAEGLQAHAKSIAIRSNQP